MKALVIGGTGPSGPFVVEGLLKRGYKVSILHRGTHEVDFSEPVEHLHGDPHFVETLQETLGTRTFDLVVGMYGRLRYVAEVIKGHTPRLVAAGGAPYKALVEGEDSPDGVPIPLSENATLFTDNERNKLTYLMTISEQAVMNAHHEGHYAATIMRYITMYGPRALAPAEWSIIRRILDGRKQIILPDGGLRLERRVYAENSAHAILLAVDQPKKSAGQIYNVADETMLTLRDWVRAIADTMNHTVEIVSMPFWLARPTRPYAGRAFHRVLDISKIKAELGYQEVVPGQEALRRTVMWWLNNRPEPGDDVEQRLGDAFDYATEDYIIKEYQESAARIREAAAVGYKHRHAYDHPKGPAGS